MKDMKVTIHWEYDQPGEDDWNSPEIQDINERIGYAISTAIFVAKQMEDDYPPDDPAYAREMAVTVEHMSPDDLILTADHTHELYGFDASEKDKRFVVHSYGPEFFGEGAAHPILRQKGGCFLFI